MNKSIQRLWLILCVALLPLGCGGGGGGGGGTHPKTAVIKLSTAGETTQSLGAVQTTLRMPSGVSVKATTNPPQTDSEVVAASGVASGAELVMGIYSSSSGTVTVYLTKSSGFGIGEFATINCDLAGTSPKSSDFSVSDLSVWDTNGSIVTGLTITFAEANE